TAPPPQPAAVVAPIFPHIEMKEKEIEQRRFPRSVLIEMARRVIRDRQCQQQGFVLDGIIRTKGEAKLLFSMSKDEEKAARAAAGEEEEQEEEEEEKKEEEEEGKPKQVGDGMFVKPVYEDGDGEKRRRKRRRRTRRTKERNKRNKRKKEKKKKEEVQFLM
ncbi:MAG: hypothetical protein EZS28_036088, partial [Streblomastix strix]